MRVRTGGALACIALVLAACSGVAAPPTTTPVPTPLQTPTPDEVVVAVKGDWGAGTRAQHEVTERMCALREEAGFDVVVTTGDNFYNPDGTATERNFGDPERCLVDGGITWRASWGNHDRAGTATREVLGAERWYAWSLGHVRFIALDSNVAGDATQRAFLERELRAAQGGVVVVAFHHPPFTVGAHRPNASVQRTWVPLFQRYRVSLVLSGHNHGYEHHVVDGIHYVVTGGGGATVYPCLRDTPELRACHAVHHFLVVRFTGRQVQIRAIRPTGATLDEISFDA